jgi:hypothetical protein
MKLRRRDQLLAQIGRRIDQEPVIAIGADCNRGLGALKFGVLGSRYPAHRTSAIPLRYATTCRGAQDDDAKHDPSPGDTNVSKVDTGHKPAPAIRSRLRREVHLRQNVKAVAAAYLRAAQAYILISMPTGTSTIFGVFQAILALLANGTHSALKIN